MSTLTVVLILLGYVLFVLFVCKFLSNSNSTYKYFNSNIESEFLKQFKIFPSRYGYQYYVLRFTNVDTLEVPVKFIEGAEFPPDMLEDPKYVIFLLDNGKVIDYKIGSKCRMLQDDEELWLILKHHIEDLFVSTA